MSDTTTEPAQAIMLEAFDPAELIVEGNYRSEIDRTITAEWVGQLAEHFKRSQRRFPVHGTPGAASPCGNHTAVAIVTRADGTLRVLIGSRRVLGCLRAGAPVLGYIAGPEGDTDAERRAELIDQFTENHGREPTTTEDDAGLVAALFDIKGTSEPKVATALGLSRPEVKAYRTLAKSQTARNAIALGLDIIQSAAVEEFAGDEYAVQRLTDVAMDHPAAFDHELASLRAGRQVRAARDALVAELTGSGCAIHGVDWIAPGDRRSLANLRDGDGEPIGPEGHDACPGRAVVISLDWTWPDKAKVAWIAANPEFEADGDGDPVVEFDDDIEARDAGMVPVWSVTGHLCTDPDGNGHASVYGPGRAKAAPETGPAADPDPEAAARARAEEVARKQAAEAAERRRVRERNTAWRAATTVRREHVTQLVCRGRLAPKGLRVAAAMLRAEAIARHETKPEMGSFGHRVAGQLLGLTGSEWDTERLILAALETAGPERTEVIELAMVLGAAEHGLSGADGVDAETWRSAEQSWWARGDSKPRAARYLRWLRDHTGYELAPIEAEVVKIAFPDDPDQPDSGPGDVGDQAAGQHPLTAQEVETAPSASAVDTGAGQAAEAADGEQPGDEGADDQGAEDEGAEDEGAEDDSPATAEAS
jgi:ParB family chromosome partitioning protein